MWHAEIIDIVDYELKLMINIKRIIITLTIIVSMIGVCGCMSNANNKAENISNLAKEYLHNRYDDEFTLKGYYGKGWAYDYSTVTFSSKKYNEALIEVRVYENEDNTYQFNDNYFNYYMESGAIDFFENLIDNDDVIIKVRFPGYIWSNDLLEAKTFLDWQKSGKCEMEVFLFSNVEIPVDVIEHYSEKVAINKIRGRVSFYTFDASSISSNILLDELLNNQEMNVKLKTRFYINLDFNVEKVI